MRRRSKTKIKQLKKQLKFSKICVVAVLIQVFIYVWIHLILSAVVGFELAPTVSCAFFAFCGAEAGLLAWIRKLDKPDKKGDDIEKSNFEESEEEQHERNFCEEDYQP